MFRYSGPTAPCRDPYYFPGVTDCSLDRISEIVSTRLEVPLANGRLRSCDLDGAGAYDLVVLSREASDGEPTAPSALYRYSFDGTLELRTERFVPLELVLPVGTMIYDFACLEANDQPGQEIAITSSTGAYLLHRASTDDPWVADAMALAAAYVRIAAGDVDGDGLDDLVLGNLAETRVLYGRGQPSPSPEEAQP